MLDFGSSTGALFPRLGKLGAVIANLRSNQNTQYTAMTSQATGIVGQLNGEPDVQAIVGQGYLGALSSLGGSVGSLMQSAAAAVVNRMVYRDNPRVAQTLTSADTLASLQEIIRQMKAQGATVRAQTVTATVTDFGTATGTRAVLNCSTKRPYDGATLENAYSETVNVRCTADSYTGGATEGNEQLTLYGAGQQTDPFAFDWPQGSGQQTQINAIDGAVSNGSNNLLTNSGWDAWTSGIPDNWELVTGTAGTDFVQDTGVVFGGDASIRIVGDGATLTEWRQLFNDSTAGSSDTLAPLSQYSFCAWLQRDGIPSGAGTLEISLEDENGNTVADAAGVSNAFTVDLTALPTLFAPYKGVFRTPLVLPTSIYLRFRLTVALDAGREIWIDKAGLGSMVQLYTSGPFFASHSGSTPLQANDVAQVSISNGRGAAGTLDTWQTLFGRLFPNEVYSNELLLPSAASPSISDSLIA